jgi:hypothetical protein
MSLVSYKYRGALVKKCDVLVSLIVRNRDRQCVTCVFLGKYPKTIKQPVKILQCGHLFSRKYGNTRFDLTNCYAQCAGCNKRHVYDTTSYTDWFITKFGVETWRELYQKTRVHKIWRIWELEIMVKNFERELKKYEAV